MRNKMNIILSYISELLLLVIIAFTLNTSTADAKRTGATAQINIENSSARLEKIKIGDNIKTVMTLTAITNAETFNVFVDTINGLELVSNDKLTYTNVSQGDVINIELELKVTAAIGQLLLTSQAVNGKYIESDLKSIFYNNSNGVETVVVEGGLKQ